MFVTPSDFYSSSQNVKCRHFRNAARFKHLWAIIPARAPSRVKEPLDPLELRFLNKKNLGIIAGPHIDPPDQNNLQRLIGVVKKSFLITMLPKLQKGNLEKKQYMYRV